MKNNITTYKIKSFVLAFFILFETIFTGYISLNAATISENTVIPEITLETADEPFTGANGVINNLTWKITKGGHLTISGSGDYDYIYVNSSRILPWCQYADYILTADINIDKITNMSYMFYDCTNLSSVDFKNTDSSNVTDMSGMFNNCSSLQSIDLSKLNTDKVTDMSWMFYNCASLQSIKVSGGYFNTSNVTTMACMFSHCSSLVELDLSVFRTDKVKDMSYMFCDCRKLEKLIWSKNGFKTNNVTDMSCMFKYCYKLKNLELSNFDTSKVKNMSSMFYSCNTINELDIQSFNTTNVTDMSRMFYACHELKNIIWNPDTFVTDNVTDMNFMFGNCYKLEKIELQSFNTSNVTNMNCMFTGCFVLQELDLKTFNTKKVTDMAGMFSACYDLTSLDLSNFDTSKVSDMEDMFYGCNSLLELDLSNFDTTTYIKDSVFTINTSDLQTFISGKDKRTYKLVTNATKWFDDYGNQYEDNTEIELKPNTTLYRINDTYNINYIYDGDLSNANDKYTYDKTAAITASVSKDHYTFDGWYLDDKYTKKITEITAGTYGDITLYAKMIPDTYAITYKNVEDILNAKQLTTAYTYGTEATPVVPTKTCYLFDGWYLDEALTKTFDGITATTEGDLVLYAKWKENHDLDKENGVVTKEATTISEGEIEYKCKNCTYTETEKIPRVVTQESQITDETILNTPDDGDIAGSDFTKFQVRAAKTTKNSIKLKWNKIEGADGYKIYGNRCGIKNPFEYIKTVKGEKKTTWTQKKLKKNSYYKYVVRAYKVVDGQEVTLAVSKTIHIATAGGSKGNAKAVNVKTDKKCKKTKSGYTLTLKKGKKYTIKASEKAGAKKINRHRNIRYDSTNKEVATVSKGVVKAKGKGTCYIYAYAQNGVYKKIKVVVK